ncbi:hypothetical protein ALO98_200007 [Pseudomonas syringae pv. tagetis]|nr:hypothetical protein ALO98_200007 [Pseudomonas syringae pv. tagetis]
MLRFRPEPLPAVRQVAGCHRLFWSVLMLDQTDSGCFCARRERSRLRQGVIIEIAIVLQSSPVSSVNRSSRDESASAFYAAEV